MNKQTKQTKVKQVSSKDILWARKMYEQTIFWGNQPLGGP